MKKRIISMIMVFMVALGFVPAMTAVKTVTEVYAADDYPARYKNAAKDALVDEWNMYNRECTSAVAWWLNSRNGVSFTNWYCGVRWGNAKNWGNAARQVGITVDKTPAVGAVAWWNGGTYGHVAWVSEVKGDTIVIEEYNYNSNGNYNCREIKASNPTGYIHIKDIPQEYYLDLNWNVDGELIYGDVPCATVDVYINGKKVAEGVSDYYAKWPVDTQYAITNIKTKSGYSYKGIVAGTTKGSIGKADTEVRLGFVSKKTNLTDQILADGWYFISTGNDTSMNYVLKLEKSNTKDGTNIVIDKWDGSDEELFYVKYLGNGYYSIKNKYSGKFVHIKNEWIANINVHQWNGSKSSNARWYLEDAGNGYFYLKNKGNKAYLDNSGGTIAKGNNVWSYEFNGTRAQMWMFIPRDAMSVQKIYSVTANIGLNLRTGASKSYSVITCMPYGREVQLLEDVGNGWFKVNCNGTVGYCMSEYLYFTREEVNVW